MKAFHCQKVLRWGDFDKVSGAGIRDGSGDFGKDPQQFVQGISGQENDDDRSVREILLVSQILVCGHEDLKSGALRSCEQQPVFQGRPSLVFCQNDFTIWQRLTDPFRNAMIQQDPLQAATGWDSKRCEAAKFMTAIACSRVTPSNSSRNSSRVIPVARFPKSASTGTRVSRKQGVPPNLAGSLQTKGSKAGSIFMRFSLSKPRGLSTLRTR